MRSRILLMPLALAFTLALVLFAFPGRGRSESPTPAASAAVEPQRPPDCSPTPRIVNIKAGASPGDLIDAVTTQPDTIVRLWPDVDMDFSNMGDRLPIRFDRCVTLTSVSESQSVIVGPSPHASATATARRRERAASVAGVGGTTPFGQLELPQARTPHSPGPVLRFGKNEESVKLFFEIRCDDDDATINDHVRISGFRLYGPSFGQQDSDNFGINIYRCVDVEISNMEIAGWGGAGIYISDDPCPDSTPPDAPCGRITRPDQIRIHDNFFHNNQHARGFSDDHTAGYGVVTNLGAWATIDRNLFDFNHHAIAGSSDTEGYMARLNLVLKGGGLHFDSLGIATFTHSFDVHGSGGGSHHNGGNAGKQFWYLWNAFQYRKGNAIKIRGKPAQCCTEILGNVFPHRGLEADAGDDAINLNTKTNVNIDSGNIINYDSFGHYGVCDFDGDRIDDLFLATGASWWFSSSGEFPWSYLNDKRELLEQVRLGYFDNDTRCDVLAQRGDGRWVISSGGKGNWQLFGTFDVPLSEVQFGRFGPDDRDIRPNATRHTTHAFRRAPDGQWYVTLLNAPAWIPVASSGFQMNQLRFGDFTGDGVTDVLAVVGGHWSISESARSPWHTLNMSLHDPVAKLYIANMDVDDNIDDILRMDWAIETFTDHGVPYMRTTLIWWRSKNGDKPWRPWKSYTFVDVNMPDSIAPIYGFAGRFGAAHGGGTLVIDPNRMGQFYSEAAARVGVRPEWPSQFAY